MAGRHELPLSYVSSVHFTKCQNLRTHHFREYFELFLLNFEFSQTFWLYLAVFILGECLNLRCTNNVGEVRLLKMIRPGSRIILSCYLVIRIAQDIFWRLHKLDHLVEDTLEQLQCVDCKRYVQFSLSPYLENNIDSNACSIR